MTERIGVLGLGYVGLPVALAFARRFPDVVGFDVDAQRVAELAGGLDRSREADPQALAETTLRLTDDEADLQGVTFFVVAVPTPIDPNRQPNLTALVRASETVGRALRPGGVVVFESTVYPGVTEDICGPAIARASGLTQGRDFKLAYSPERINPGDREHTLERVVKVVAGQDDETLERVAAAYAAIVEPGVYRAKSIKVAEAAKAIENTQRDLNIALMNELAVLFDRLGLRTKDVLDAAGTKWNFLRFHPGLVGGHCIGVDPYYLTAKAEEVGYHPEVILAGRRINDGMGRFLAQRMVKLLVHADQPVKGARVGVLGLSFKEDVSDIRNTRVADLVAELREFGIEPLVHDPHADPDDAQREYGLELVPREALSRLNAVVIAVAHDVYRRTPPAELLDGVVPGGVVVDVKSILEPEAVPPGLAYWSL